MFYHDYFTDTSKNTFTSSFLLNLRKILVSIPLHYLHTYLVKVETALNFNESKIRSYTKILISILTSICEEYFHMAKTTVMCSIKLKPSSQISGPECEV